MEITEKPFILISGSNGFCLQLTNPGTGEIGYVRIVMGDSAYGEATLAYCHDLSKVNTPFDGFDFALDPKHSADGSATWLYQNQDDYNTKNLTKNESAEFFAPGSMIHVIAKGDPDRFSPNNFVYDGGKLVADETIVTGDTRRSDRLNSLFTN